MSAEQSHKRYLHPNIPLLGICMCLFMSGQSVIVSSSALVGAALSPIAGLSTLPMAVVAIAATLTTIPAGKLMDRIGRKKALQLSTLFGMSGAVLTGLSISIGSFTGFILGVMLVGIFNGFGNFFRFTAADSVGVAYKSRAVSYVMIGGIAAAIVGPNLASYTRLWFGEAEFAATYLIIIVFYIGIAGILHYVRIEDRPADPRPTAMPQAGTGRSLKQVALQPTYIVAVICGMLGYGVMSLVMTATPLAMHDHALHFDDTAFVIQWHILAMFVPSFFTGSLIARFGIIPVMLTGALLGFFCVGINLLGTSKAHFLFALICLGLSWSFLFIGATTMLTETYEPEEKNRAQALNDFLVFSAVAVASLSAGALQNLFGWEAVNRGVIPLLLIILVSLVWLGLRNKRERQVQE